MANKVKPITSFPKVPSNKDQIAIDGKKWIYNANVPGWEALQVTDPIVEAQIVKTEERVEQNLRSGILSGGLISINSTDSSKIDVAQGTGLIVTTTGGGSGSTSNPSTTVSAVSWSAKTSITLQNISTSDITWIYIDSSGSVNQQDTAFTDNQYQTHIILGIVLHPNRSSVSLARTFPLVSFGVTNQYDDYIRILGPAKISGHKISGVSGQLKLNRSAGTAYVFGANYQSSASNPNHITESSQSNCVLWRYYRDVSNPTGFSIQYNQSILNPGKYDNGSGTLQNVGSSEWSIQRVFYIPNNTNTLHLYYGIDKYSTKSEAIEAVQDEDFTESDLTKDRAIFCGWGIVRGGSSDLSNSNDFEFIQSGIFRNSGGVVSTGGGTSTVSSLDDLSDVVINSPSSNQVLMYNGSNWTNQSLPPDTGINFISSASAPDVNIYNEGDRWYNTSTGIEYVLIFDGGGDKFWVNIYISPNEDFILEQLTKITTFISSATAPNVNDYREGDRWFDTTNGKEYTLIDDPGGKQWVNLHTEFISHTHEITEISNLQNELDSKVEFSYGSTPPSLPNIGDRWIDSNTGEEFVYVYDGTSYQWMQPTAGAIVGIISFNTTVVTSSSYSASSNDCYIGVDYAGLVTITLPPSPTTGKFIIVKDESGNASSSSRYITILPESVSDNIDNDSSAIININNGGVQLIYRNGWRIV